MQPSPNARAVYKRKASLSRPRARVTYGEIAAAAAALGFDYPVNRYEKVVAGHEVSQPVLDAAWAALDVIEERVREGARLDDLQRRAADGDREAQDELDLMELAA